MRTTFMQKSHEVDRKWFVVDAADKTLGRLSTEVATLLRGKHKPTFTPHVDCGDYVIIINADKITLTGNKLENKLYYRHSGYQGRAMGKKLFVYAGSEHPHAAQKPEVYELRG